MNARLHAVVSVTLLLIVGFFSLESMSPCLPGIALHFQRSISDAQAVYTLFIIGVGISQPLYGLLSDYLGRRRLILSGLFIYIIASLICFEALTFSWFLTGRFLQGVGASSGLILSKSINRDFFHGKGLAKVYSLVTVFLSLMSLIAPVLSSQLQFYFSFYVIFLLMAILALFAFIYIVLFFKDAKFSRQFQRDDYRQITHNKTLIFYGIAAGLVLSLFSVVPMVNTFILQHQLGVNLKLYGWIAMCIASGEMFGTAFNMLCMRYFSLRLINQFNYLLLGVSALLLLFVPLKATLLAILLFVVFFTTGALLPNLAAIAYSCYKEKIGFIGAVYSVLQSIVVSIAATCIAFFLPAKLLLAFYLLLVAVLASILSAYYHKSQQVISQADNEQRSQV